MNLKFQLRELAARSERVVELARGDYAIPAMKKIFAGQGDRLPHEVPGMVGALRGDAGKMQSHYAQLGKRNNYYDQLAKNPEEIQKRLNHLRSYSAKEIRWSRLSPEQRAARLGDTRLPFAQRFSMALERARAT
jgi:hypothetical protein